DRGQFAVRLERLEHLEAVAVGHHDVEDDDVRHVPAHRVDDLPAVGDCAHLVTFKVEDEAKRFDDMWLVFGDENALRQGTIPLVMMIIGRSWLGYAPNLPATPPPLNPPPAAREIAGAWRCW